MVGLRKQNKINKIGIKVDANVNTHTPASSSNTSKSFFFDIFFRVVLKLSRFMNSKRGIFAFGVEIV